MRKKLLYHEVKNYIEIESNSGCKLLSQNFDNPKLNIEIMCYCGNIFYALFNNFKYYGKRQCNDCGYKISSIKNSFGFNKIRESVNNIGFILEPQEIKNITNKILISSKEGYKTFVYYSHLINGHQPRFFHTSNPYTIQNIKLWCKLNTKPFELVSKIYEGISIVLYWQCNICNEKWNANWNSIHNNGSGCPYCRGLKVGLNNSLAKLNPVLCEEWNYSKNKDTPNDYALYSNKEVWWKCRECGNEWRTSISNRSQGRGCPKCNESKGEKRINDYLINNNYIFKSQYKFKDCKNIKQLPFDFIIFDKHNNIFCLIEYDGEFHYKPARFSKDKEKMLKKLKKCQQNDNIKNEYCKNNNIPLLRIPYWDFDNIENILSKQL